MYVKEILDSEDDLYAEHRGGGHARGGGGGFTHLPLMLRGAAAACAEEEEEEEEEEVETVVVRRWPREDDLDPATWELPPLAGEFNESDGYQPPK